MDWLKRDQITTMQASPIRYSQVKICLLDMGGVVIRVHPDRVFQHWSAASGQTVDYLAARWQIESNYKALETGQISFTTYAASVSKLLQIRLSESDCRTGWNLLVGSPYTAVIEQLKEICRYLPLYCFTNSNPEHEKVFTNKYSKDLAIFTQIFNSCRIGFRKPDVQSFRHVAQLMNTNPQHVLFIDDNLENVEGASAAGMQSAHTHSEEQTLDLLKGLLKALSKKKLTNTTNEQNAT